NNSFTVLAFWVGSSMVSTTTPSSPRSQRIMFCSVIACSLDSYGSAPRSLRFSSRVAVVPRLPAARGPAVGASEPLADGGPAPAAADAQPHQGVPGLAAFQFVHHGADQHRAGGAERVAHRDGPAVDVQLLAGDIHV